jgi:hypothetical protein
MAITQADLDNLEKALASGVLSVRQGDRMVTYDSVAALIQRIEYVKSALAQQSGHRRTRIFRTQYGKGL